MNTQSVRSHFQILFVVLGALLLSQCGTSDQTGVSIQVAPKSPVLFTAPTSIVLTTPTPSASASTGLTTITLGADWFGANYTFVNNNVVDISFVQVLVTIVGTVQGVTKTSTLTLGPSDINYFTTATIISAPDSNSISTVAANHTSQALNFYVQSIEQDYDSTSLSITMEFDGYYGDQTNPLQRLSKIIYFSTQ